MLCFDSLLQLVNLHRNQRYFVIKLHTWFCPSYFLKTNIKFYCIYQYFMSINSFFQHRICFSIQPQLQLVNLRRNRRYFVIKLHTWFCLSHFLKTNIKFYCIYQYFMSINSFFNTSIYDWFRLEHRFISKCVVMFFIDISSSINGKSAFLQTQA
jgi:hypothetical protein